MTDLERFFRRLVENLASSDPARLHRPIPLEDIHGSIIPYRSNRRALLLESSEDYELILLRLCAGEGSLVRTEPEEARARFAEEAASSNPDLGVLHQFEKVLITIRSEPLARALAPETDPDLPYAPPPGGPVLSGLDLEGLDPIHDLAPAAPDLAEDVESPSDHTPDLIDDTTELSDETEHCLYCGDVLPGGRAVRFCPHCGQRQTPPECPRCHSDVEPGWRHCVSCGTALAGG
ncbi:MAG TPA: zinc ribbon domain-containing protein [Gemmatimonadales bacterium]|nr:zinc ribbon domain-containing protein [Gemmatimonadales bacterium]